MVQSEKEQSGDDHDVGVVRQDMQMDLLCNWPRQVANERANILDQRHDEAELKMLIAKEGRDCQHETRAGK